MPPNANLVVATFRSLSDFRVWMQGIPADARERILRMAMVEDTRSGVQWLLFTDSTSVPGDRTVEQDAAGAPYAVLRVFSVPADLSDDPPRLWAWCLSVGDGFQAASMN